MAIVLLLGLISGQQICYAYKAVAYNGAGYAATGDGSRIDFFSAEGEMTGSVPVKEGVVLNDVNFFGDLVVAGGKDVFLVYDGKDVIYGEVRGEVVSLDVYLGWLFVSVNTGSGAQVLSFLSADDYPVVAPMSLKGNIVSASAAGYDFYGVTDAGEIFCTHNGSDWSVFDFNAEYAGFYPEVSFSAVAVSNASVAVAGSDSSGNNVMFVSSKGSVWSERELSYLEGGSPLMLQETVLGLYYDILGDQFIATCTGGILFRIPACSHCNAPVAVNANELYALAPAQGGDFFVVGSDSFSSIVRR